MFDAGIESFEFGQLIEQVLAKVINNCLHLFLDLDDIYQVTVLIQFSGFQLDLHHIVVGMGIVFSAPVASDQKVSGNKILFYGEGVHVYFLWSGIGLAGLSVIVKNKLQGLLGCLVQQTIGFGGARQGHAMTDELFGLAFAYHIPGHGEASLLVPASA